MCPLGDKEKVVATPCRTVTDSVLQHITSSREIMTREKQQQQEAEEERPHPGSGASAAAIAAAAVAVSCSPHRHSSSSSKMYFNRRAKKIHSEGEQLVLTTIRQEASELQDPGQGAGADMCARLTDRLDKSEFRSN
ncbi:unnamed protein product [Pleuronectes platessa]|uniref:Uncharacterized protein n=1 Tax=Pleuronectes platessa TaxID=8262 RepID=A0A9N7U2U8_PLEPL|nr:unnamed protein product [Pleuronectes platessa]